MSILLALTVLATAVAGQTDASAQIREVLENQRLAWNKGDLQTFMHSYWNNDSLMFVGKNGVTYGWQNTLENYKKGYPGKDQMGVLSFDVLHVNRLSNDYYYVVGKWSLKRSAGDVGGHYTLVFRRIEGKWLIVSDHSS